MTKTLTDRLEQLRAIEAEVEQHGLLFPGEIPEALPIKDMRLVEAVFQHRDVSDRRIEDERHINILRKAIGTNAADPRFLPPLVVWWSGAAWYLIDGFHRHEAYRRAGVHQPVPVRVWGGTETHQNGLGDAIAFAAGANARDKLKMSKDDKANAAWYLTALRSGSRSFVVMKCAVSDGLVAEMRRTRQKLFDTDNPETGEPYTQDELIGMDWKTAREAAKGELRETPEDFDSEAELNRRAEDYRERVYRHFGNKPQIDFEAFSLALKNSDRSIPAKYVQTAAWRNAIEDEVEAQVEDRLTEILDDLEGGNPEFAKVVPALRKLLESDF